VERGKASLTPRLEKEVVRQFIRGIAPLEDAGKLGALLLQLSPAFGPRKHRLNELDSLLELLGHYRLAIELRNRDWVAREQLAETRRFFSRRKLTFVMVDGPPDSHFMILPSIDLLTTKELAYLRAHGRNAEGYIRERTVAGRFNYDYPRSELEEIAERAARLVRDVEEMHVVFNNNKADYAPRAAASFQQLLHQTHPEALPAELERKELAYA
jgi:uncharacterized protein YecE (DUF72 family)